MLASTPDLSHSSYSDPISVDLDLFTSTSSGMKGEFKINFMQAGRI